MPNPTHPDDCPTRDLPVGCRFAWFRNWLPGVCHCPRVGYGMGAYAERPYGE